MARRPTQTEEPDEVEADEDEEEEEEQLAGRPHRPLEMGRDFDAEYADRTGAGHGAIRRDAREVQEDFMLMSRRDVESLHKKALGGMKKFLDDRAACDPTRSLGGVALAGVEIGVGAGLAAYLAQRFRQNGVPVSPSLALAIIGLFGLGASQFEMFGKLSPDVRNAMFGVLASAIALWAAGRGIITAEQAAGIRTGTGQLLPPGGQQQQLGAPASAFGAHTGGFAPAQPFQAHGVMMQTTTGQQPMVVMSAADFHGLLRRAS